MAQVRNEQLLRRMALVLKELREEQNFTQGEVYAETRIHIGRIEACQANVSVSTLFEVLKFLRTDLSEFFNRVEKK